MKFQKSFACLFLIVGASFATPQTAQAQDAWKDVPAKGLLQNLKKASAKAVKGCPQGKTIGEALKYFQKRQLDAGSKEQGARCRPDGSKKDAKVCMVEFFIPATDNGEGEVLWGLQYYIKKNDPKSIREATCLALAG